MEQNNKKIISIAIIVALIIIAGVITVCMWGFSKELRYEESQRIDILVEQKVDEKQIKSIADEVLGMHNKVQVVEIYEEMVTIRAKEISEEQKNTIISKVKEIYEFEQTAEETDIMQVPATRFRDIYSKYVIPFIVCYVLVTIYIVIINYKKGILKTLIKSAGIPVVAELFLLSWIAIARIPMGRLTPVLVIFVYVASVLYLIKENEE